jgi:hypothetical protein
MEMYKRGARASLAAASTPEHRQRVIERFRQLGVRFTNDGEVEE